MSGSTIPLSVLDLAPVGPDTSPEQALRDVVEVARNADESGYLRFWVAEHHGSVKTAGSAPAVLIGHIAVVTRNIRVGSGGVMLTNHAPLVVAEQFGVLECLHRGRIDLGVGRSAGGSDASRTLDEALRRGPLAGHEFPESVDELLGFLRGTLPSDHPYAGIRVSPRPECPPPVYVLGASENGARIAAERGLPFAYGHHLGRGKARPVSLTRYRDEFRANESGTPPHVIVSVNVVCADTDTEAEQIAMDRSVYEIRRLGVNAVPPIGAEANPRERHQAAESLIEANLVHGGPTRVVEQLSELADALGADELMLVPYDFSGAGRGRTLRLIAREYASSVTTPHASVDAGQRGWT